MFKRLFIDDLFVVLAWICLLVFHAVWQRYADDAYRVWKVASGELPVTLAALEWSSSLEKTMVVSSFCYSFGLWFIKLNFLFFFKRLGQNVMYQKLVWWIVLAFVTTCFANHIGIIPWNCIIGNPLEKAGTCPLYR